MSHAPDDPGHSHGHDDHDHDHGHDHAAPASVPYETRDPLEAGAGRGATLFFDAFSGVAGDMTIAALADLGVPTSVFEEAVGALPLEGASLVFGQATFSGIVATQFDVQVQGKQPQRTYAAIEAMLREALLPEGTKALARSIFRRLGEAEARVHRMDLDAVHFHEVGAVDAIVDIVGAAAGLDYLGATVVASPLPMGHGFVKAQHGVLPLPAPATVSCLAGVPTYEVPLEAELVTPTGAAIVATAASSFARWPNIAPRRVGFGAGHRRLPDRPNMLRLVLGDAVKAAEPEDDALVVLEANVDDLTGELAGHAIAVILEAGALDAWATPITMKKGRPALTVSALAPRATAGLVADTLLRETTSLGVRRHDVQRTARPRTTVAVATRFGSVPVKVSSGPYGPPQIKPEFDACVACAREHGVPVREVMAAALAAYGG